MVRVCNRKSEKAKNRVYICNHVTGRWIKHQKPVQRRINRKINAKHRSNGKRKIKAVRRPKETKANYECHTNIDNDVVVLDKCPRYVKHIKLGEMLGEGAFGKVYSATGVYGENVINLAVKIVKCRDASEIYNEVEYSYYMSDVHIGPMVYDAFFKVNAGYANNPQKDYPYIQYILMEPFDGNIQQLLKRGDINMRTKACAVREMCLLLEDQIFKYGLECYDIKPTNYVYKIDKGLIVRMIDFGVDWCRQSEKKTKIIKNVIYLVLLLQLAYLIKRYITGDPRILGVFNKIPIFKKRKLYIYYIQNELLRNRSLMKVFHHYVDPIKHSVDGHGDPIRGGVPLYNILKHLMDTIV